MPVESEGNRRRSSGAVKQDFVMVIVRQRLKPDGRFHLEPLEGTRNGEKGGNMTTLTDLPT